jgi:hypothetical protein
MDLDADFTADELETLQEEGVDDPFLAGAGAG